MAITFESVVHQYVYERVRRILDGAGEGLYTASEDSPSLRVHQGSASARLFVIPLTDDEAVVRVLSWVVRGANTKDPELMRFLLLKNNERNLGAFAIDQDGDVVLKYSFIGTTCTEADIMSAITAVVAGADDIDDEIVARWGGETALGPA